MVEKDQILQQEHKPVFEKKEGEESENQSVFKHTSLEAPFQTSTEENTVDYSSAQALLNDESRIFNLNSAKMKRVKNAIQELEQVLDRPADGVYTAENLAEFKRYYEEAIFACNEYVNHKKHNERWKKVNANLLRIAKEAALLERAGSLLSSKKISGEAKDLRSLLESAENYQEEKTEINDKKEEEVIDPNQPVYISRRNLYSFKNKSVYGASAKASYQNKKDIAALIPKDLSAFDQETKDAVELIKKWRNCDILREKSAKGKRLQFENEKSITKELYNKLPILKQSKDQKILEIATMLESTMKGTLIVDKNSKNTHDFSKSLENNYAENFYGSKMKKNIKIKLIDRKDEPLFPHEPNISDVKQGNVGDCYFLTALATLLEKNPKLITENMSDLGDSVAVRFENLGRPHVVIVKKTTLHDDKDQRAVGANQVPLWVSMMEKAYAAVLAGYVKGCDGNQSIAMLSSKHQQDARMNQNSVLAEFSLIKQGNPYNALDAGGEADRFIEIFSGTFFSGERSLVGYHVKAQAVSDIAKAARNTMLMENDSQTQKYQKVMVDHAIYDKLIHDCINENFTRTKVKTWSEYAEGLDTVEEELKAGNLPIEKEKESDFLEYISILRKYSKKNKKILQVDHSLIGEGAYSEKERKVFEELETAAKDKRIVTVRHRANHKFLKKKKNDPNGATEKDSGGFFSSHAYEFIGTERVSENGVDRMFVILRNPWADAVRMYDNEGKAILLTNTSEKDEKAKTRKINGEDRMVGFTHVDTNGVFHMELRDFLNMGESYKVERKA